MNYLRGLVALFILCGMSLNASYLHKDELIYNPAFEQAIEKIGSELEEKSGIRVLLVMLKKLPKDVGMVEYERTLLKEATTPTVLLAFSELDMKIDILVSDNKLYELFDKEQILSPAASFVQAVVMAVFYAHDFDSFRSMISNYGGTIAPILAQKAKDNELHSKYSAAMFNGYADLASQIASSQNIKLDSDVGEANQNSIIFVKLIFYGFILYAIYLMFRRKIAKGSDEKR